MNLRPLATALLAAVFAAAIPGGLRAYDAPQFSLVPFDADGIFLPENEKQSLLEALAAVVSNFPETSRIDSDLKEKAIAVGLEIDPLHHRLRQAHSDMLEGRAPRPTEYFDSQSSATEALWSTASRLLTPPVEPEEGKLAALLMEISLLVHPAPPGDRLREFVVVLGEDIDRWGRSVALQPDDNPSSMRIRKLITEGTELLAENPEPPAGRPAMAETTGPDTPAKPIPDDKPTVPKPPRSTVDPIIVSFPCVIEVSAIGTKPVPGTFALAVRPPDGGVERELFPFLEEDPKDYPKLPLFSGRRGFSLMATEISGSAAAAKGWEWTAGHVGEMNFEPMAGADFPGPRRIVEGNADLAARVALVAAFGPGLPDPAFVFAGTMDPATSFGRLETDPIETIETAASLGAEFILFPESSIPGLVGSLQRSGRLRLLFETLLVSFSDVDSLAATVNSPPDSALREAVAAFAEVEAVSDKLPLEEFVRNPKVQERLESILATYPRLLSAQAMLEYGRTPIPQEIVIEASVRQIDEHVLPFAAIRDGDFDFAELREKLDGAQTGLSLIRTDVHPAVRDYLGSAEDLLEAAEFFLSLSNQTSTIAEQRLREAEAAADEMMTQRGKLGLTVDDEE